MKELRSILDAMWCVVVVVNIIYISTSLHLISPAPWYGWVLLIAAAAGSAR